MTQERILCILNRFEEAIREKNEEVSLKLFVELVNHAKSHTSEKGITALKTYSELTEEDRKRFLKDVFSLSEFISLDGFLLVRRTLSIRATRSELLTALRSRNDKVVGWYVKNNYSLVARACADEVDRLYVCKLLGN